MKKILGCFLCVMLLIFWVSSAGAEMINLADEGRGDTETLINSYGTATFIVAPTEITYPSSGTGVFQPYLSIQANGSEEGFNTDYKPLPLDAKRAGDSGDKGWTHSITVGDLYESTTGVFEFLLDLNEPKNEKSLITLTGIEIYIESADPNTLVGTGFAPDKASLSNLVYDLGEDNSVLMDYSFWQGQGQNVDTLIYIPIDLTGFSSNDYVYTYWAFGSADDPEAEDSNAGFEEIIVRGFSVPEPGTLFLLGTGLIGFTLFGRKKYIKS